ncbi:hypothetical protein HZB74_02925 [Candidatus Saccharibacteria bacterium]|nr:hypothetical protein [Candidatus Saccharibacteria bacterium]
MISQNFIFLIPFIHIWGQVSYILTTVRGKTKPNRVSWFLWAVIAFIIFSAQIDEGVGVQVILTFLAGFGPLMVFLASFANKKAYWKISNLDIVCGVLSVLAIILWLATGSGLYAIGLCIIADLLASIPTIAKSFNFPESENFVIFRNAMIGAVITLLTINEWTFAVSAFAIYIALINLLLVLLIKFKFGLLIKNKLATR